MARSLHGSRRARWIRAGSGRPAQAPDRDGLRPAGPSDVLSGERDDCPRRAVRAEELHLEPVGALVDSDHHTEIAAAQARSGAAPSDDDLIQLLEHHLLPPGTAVTNRGRRSPCRTIHTDTTTGDPPPGLRRRPRTMYRSNSCSATCVRRASASRHQADARKPNFAKNDALARPNGCAAASK